MVANDRNLDHDPGDCFERLVLGHQQVMACSESMVALGGDIGAHVVAHRIVASSDPDDVGSLIVSDRFLLDRQRAISTNRDSRTTVTLISPG